MHTPLPPAGWLDHRPGWLPAAAADRLLADLRAGLAWEQREIVLFGRRVLQPRLIAWAGALPYRYSGQTLEPRPFTTELERVLDAVRRATGVPFNHVLANRYRDGQDSMGYHSDDEAELGPDPTVATLSLGATRRFVVQPRRKSDGPPRAFELEHGGLVVMGGDCQRHHRHGIPRQPAVRDERVSLTFRSILANPQQGEHP